MTEEKKIICQKCQVEMEPRKTTLFYQNNRFYYDLPTCPKCGQRYVDVELVKSKMHEVESLLEDK